MSVKEIKWSGSSQSDMIEELEDGNDLYFKITDERSRWLGSTFKVSAAEYARKRDYYEQSGGFYAKNAKNTALANLSHGVNLRGVDGKGKTVDVKYNKYDIVWLYGFDGETKIIFAPPESRAQNNTFDIFGNPISIGSLVIGSSETQIYVGNVDHFKVGPSNTFVRIKPIATKNTPTVPKEVSINVRQVILVTKTLQDDILISKLSH